MVNDEYAGNNVLGLSRFSTRASSYNSLYVSNLMVQRGWCMDLLIDRFEITRSLLRPPTVHIRCL